MSEPTTEAGRRLADEVGVSYRINLIVAAEQEARRQALAEVRAAVGGCPDYEQEDCGCTCHEVDLDKLEASE